MNKVLHDKVVIHPTEDVPMTLLKFVANEALERAMELDGGARHIPAFHADGWTITIETPHGIIGLWSSWLGNKFHLGYPGPVTPTVSPTEVDALIRRHLGVARAEPVPRVEATAVETPYTGEYKDPDKPLEINALGQTIAYRERSPVRWASYCGPRVSSDPQEPGRVSSDPQEPGRVSSDPREPGRVSSDPQEPGRVSSDPQEPGRVWIEHSHFFSHTTEFRFIAPEAEAEQALSAALYGHDSGWNIHTYPYPQANRYAPEGPTVAPGHIQMYRDRFLALACALAQALGGAHAVNVDYGFIMTPAQLRALGYEDIRWLKGSPDTYRGWGNEIVLAGRRLAGGQTEHLLLRSANQLVPWAAIRRIPLGGAARVLTAQDLLDFLTF